MMSARQAFCVLTIALCCVCSYVVAADKGQDLEDKPEEIPPGGPPASGVVLPASSPCPPDPPGGDGNSQCLESGGGRGNDDHFNPGPRQELEKLLSRVINTNGDHREEGSVSSGTKNELTEPGTEEEQVQEDTGNHDKKPGVDTETPGVPTSSEERRGVGVEILSPSREAGPGGNVHTENEEGASVPEVREEDGSTADGRGKGSQTAAEKTEEQKESHPQGERTENAGRTEASSTNEVGTTGNEENNVNQQAEGNGVQSTSETSPPPTEGDAMRDNVNTTSNEESTTTTTNTTTTTTLPPELTNNKKGDADSSSSISSSVWVRVPLLIVVTLSCILVC
ncbi:uncharacterized protein TM35_001531000 [Trypanosoma theileri]|uniref:Mucin-associated surface protein (MASP) n=1 Tax=Trypanosoma theileri TaxID=67003 RepID=A0A1X0NDK5_9TRYP|nr:uncharacterized protein TM35_001531000 [Trypanosoma theileri]ORC80610.1 hypothetical protein TM35_001531000 [Trypanosoma theileri]